MKVIILTKPEEKFPQIKENIERAAKELKAEVQVIISSNFRDYAHLSVNPGLTPIIIMDNITEFAGNKFPPFEALKKKVAIHAFNK